MTATLAYTRFELVRAFRNRRFFFFSLAFPLVLYLLIAGPNAARTTSAAAGSPPASTSWSASPRSGP